MRTVLVTLLALVGCGGSLHRFPLAEVVWEDDDEVPVPAPPKEFYSPYIWDGMDQAAFRPLAKVFGLYDRQGEAENVNALDEVPDSSWYRNRLSRRLMTPNEVATGACDGLDDDIPKPWTVTSGKPDGSNPGFFIRDGTGQKYLLKTDGDSQKERPSGADTVGASIYHAAGYFVPCNRVVVMTKQALVLGEGAEVKLTSGFRERMTDAHVQAVLDKATPLGDGRYRASVSQFIDGVPISPWRYEGTRADDPNDVIEHASRRELRGMYVLAAWTSHIDSRQENTLAAWMKTGPGDAGHVRHYLIDFGDTFGILFAWDDLARRFGHSGYFDLPAMAADYLTLGLLDRPWHHARFGAAGKELGYFDARRFVPDKWQPGYPNPAFQRHTERDAAWMTRIIARIEEPHIAALVARGRFSDPVVAAELERILIERRRRILERYLTRLSPLTWPKMKEQTLCLEDLAVKSRIRSAFRRRAAARGFRGPRLAPFAVGAPRVSPDGDVCVPVPGPEGTEPEYFIVDLSVWSENQDQPGPARVHLYLTSDGPRIAGLERPAGHEVPRP